MADVRAKLVGVFPHDRRTLSEVTSEELMRGSITRLQEGSFGALEYQP